MSHLHVSDPAVRRRRARPAGGWGGPVQVTTIVVLGLVWLLLWGRYDLPTLLMGLLLGIVVARVFPLPRLQFTGTVRPHWWVLLALRLVADLMVASLQVAWTAITVGPRVRNAIIRVPLRTDSDFVLAQVAELTTLVPGSVVLETRRAVAAGPAGAAGGPPGTNTLYVHVMHVRDDDDVEAARRTVRALEARVIRAFGTRQQLRMLRDERRTGRTAGDGSTS